MEAVYDGLKAVMDNSQYRAWTEVTVFQAKQSYFKARQGNSASINLRRIEILNN